VLELIISGSKRQNIVHVLDWSDHYCFYQCPGPCRRIWGVFLWH